MNLQSLKGSDSPKWLCTYFVEILDYKSEREKWQGDFNVYGIVEVLWVIGKLRRVLKSR